MIRNIEDILVGLTTEFGPDESSSALGYGLSLAQKAGAHVTVQAVSVKLHLTSYWIGSFAAGLVAAENQRLQAMAEAAAEIARSRAASAGVTCTVESPVLTAGELLTAFATQARLHDLAVIDAEPQTVNLDRGLIEALLMQSGRPLIVVPSGWDAFRGQRILFAWDGSARATRAVADALPILRAAEAVEVVCVTGEKPLADTVTGTDIAPHLTRHGVHVQVSTLPAVNGDVAETLSRHATQAGADMIVMGGYVHSRLREWVFGGVTQSLLKTSPVPLFMAY